MFIPTSEVHICNLALARLGQGPIVSINTPTTTAADTCKLHYHQTRRKLLRKHIFNFSRKYLVLTAEDSVEPAFGFETAYALPNDFIRLLGLGDVTYFNGDLAPALYDISNGYIYTDYGDDDGLNMLYVFDAKDVTKYDPLFVDLLRLELAVDMAYAFSLKQSLVKTITDERDAATLSAAAVAGQEKPPRRVQRSKLRDARRKGGLSRDNTRI